MGDHSTTTTLALTGRWQAEMSKKVICPEGPRGNTGPTAAERTEAIPVGIAGRPGTITRKPLTTIPAGQAAPARWLSRYVHSVELDALNGSFDICASKMSWIKRVCEDGIASAPRNEAQYLNALEKIRSIASNIVSGRDVFGRDRSYVPLLTFRTLSEHLQQQLDYAQQLEAALLGLGTEANAQQDLRSKVDAAINAMRSTKSALATGIQLDFIKLDTLNDEIGNLRKEQDRLWHELEESSSAFQNAVAAQSGGCRFKQVLSFATMAVAIYATGGAAAALAQSSIAAVQQIRGIRVADTNTGLLNQFQKDIAEISSIIEPAGADYSAFQTSFNRAQQAIADYESQRPTAARTPTIDTGDYAKIVADKAAFDRVMERYRGMAVAEKYKQLMDTFVSVAQTRNLRILEHDSTVRDIWQAWANMQVIEDQVGLIVSNATFDYDIASVVDSVEGMLDQLKWSALNTVSTMARSLEYLSGERSRIDYQDRKVGVIAGAASQVTGAYMQKLQARPQEATRSSGLKIPLRRLLSPSSMNAFLAGEQVSVVLAEDEEIFLHKYGLTTRRIYLEPKQGAGRFTLLFAHQGRSLMRLRDGSFAAYTHVLITGTHEVGDSGEQIWDGSTGADGDFVGVSPYGPWRIKLIVERARASAFADAAIGFDVQGYTYFPRAVTSQA